jgi:hypothetical protein
MQSLQMLTSASSGRSHSHRAHFLPFKDGAFINYIGYGKLDILLVRNNSFNRNSNIIDWLTTIYSVLYSFCRNKHGLLKLIEVVRPCLNFGSFNA